MRALIIGVVVFLLLGMAIALLGGTGPIEYAVALILSVVVAGGSVLLRRRKYLG